MPSGMIVYMGKERTPGACEIYRGNQPAYFINQNAKNWNMSWMYFERLQEQYANDGINGLLNTLRSVDLWIFPRAFIPDGEDQDKVLKSVASLYALIRATGGRIVYETDDDYSNEYRHVVDGDAITPIRWADAYTVTTSILGKHLRKHGASVPFYALPNSLDPALWANDATTPQTSTSDKIVIGLSGSATHVEDWREAAKALRRLIANYPDKVELWLTAYHPPYLDGVEAVRIPPLDYVNYSQMVRGCDIIMAPVNDDPFNLGKSPIKATEGMGAKRMLGQIPAGAAVIATDNPIYGQEIRHEKTGLLTPNTEEDWYSSLKLLITNESLRKTLQEKAYNWVWKHRDASKTWREWVSAYTKILSKKPNNIALPL